MNPPSSESFIPLNAAAPVLRERSDFKVTVVKDATNLRPFHPLGRPASAVPGSPACEPKVTMQREGDRVTGIHIQCTCGQMIELSCDYPVV